MVNKILKNGKNIFLSRQSSILGAATILMATVAISRILGLLRSRLLAQYFTPDEAAVYFAAFRLPDLIYNLLIFGALSVAFIPVFSHIMEKEGKAKAFHFAQGLLSLGMVLFGIASFLAIVFAPQIAFLIAPGFNTIQRAEMIGLSRMLFAAQFLFVIGGLLTSVLQTFKHYLIPALSGILYNVGIIIGIIFLSPMFGLYGVVFGVMIGAFFYVLIQIPLAYKVGFRLKWSDDFWQKGVREVWKLMLPRTVAIAGDQLRTTFNLSLASLITVGSVTMLTLAQQLYLVPVGLFIATMAQAVLPVLSKLEAKSDRKSFVNTLVTSIHQVIFLIVPAAAILVVLRIPVVRLAFGADQFTWEATVLTGKTVAWLAVGLIAEALSVMLMRAYYALHDTTTPVKIALVGLGVDLIVSVIGVLVMHQDVWILGLSSTIGGFVSAVLMFILLHRKIGGLWSREFFSPFFRMMAAAFVMAVSLYIPIKLLDQVVFDTTRTVNLIAITGIAGGCGMIMYLILTRLLQVKEALMVIAYTRGKLKGFQLKSDEVDLTETVDESK